VKKIFALLSIIVAVLCTQKLIGPSFAEEQSTAPSLVVLYKPVVEDYYPRFSKKSGEKGDVEVRLIIGEDGLVSDAIVLRSSNYPRLDRAALEIGRKYRFTPLTLSGKPTAWSTNLLVTFGSKSDDSKTTP